MLCTVLDCTPNDLMTPEPDNVIARRPRTSEAANGSGNDKDGDGNGGGAARPAVAHPTRDASSHARACRNAHQQGGGQIIPGAGIDAPLRVPPKCNACQDHRVAWTSPRVDYCYECLPGGPFAPPPCRTCGDTGDYFSQGLCALCHPRSPQHPGSCKGCLAWGVYPKYNWTCWVCRWWQSHYQQGSCAYCGRASTVSDQQACRLCLENARLEQEPGRPLDLAAANTQSQQLFFANMVFKRRVTPLPAYVTWDGRWSKKNKNQLPYPPGTRFDKDAPEQLTLFNMDPDPEVLRQRILVEDSELTRYCAAIVADHARRYGWSVRQRNAVIQSLRMLQTLAPTPSAKVRASDVIALAATTAPSPPPSTFSPKQSS